MNPPSTTVSGTIINSVMSHFHHYLVVCILFVSFLLGGSHLPAWLIDRGFGRRCAGRVETSWLSTRVWVPSETGEMGEDGLGWIWMLLRISFGCS